MKCERAAFLTMMGVWVTSTVVAQSKYKEVEVKNGATIAGHVVFVGEPPRILFPVTKNPEVCCAGGETERPSPRIVLGKEGGVKNTVVYLTGVMEGKAFSDKKAQLDQTKCAYEPHILLAPQGTKMMMRNSDPVLHNAHGYFMKNDAFNLAFPTQGQNVEVPLRREGVLSIKCDAGHSWMSAYVFVMSHPYYAVTDEEGRFKLDNIPPGKPYNLRVWHEGWKINKIVEPYIFSDDVHVDVPVKPGEGESLVLAFELKDDGTLSQRK
jgi:hypothetical protein